MKQEMLHFSSADKKTQLGAVLWLPEGDAKGIIQVSHGMKEHLGRYEPFAGFITKKGWIVCGNNHLGHGDSLIDGELGYFGSGPVPDYLIDDLRQFNRLMRERFEGLPLFLLGHSMGSFIARRYLTVYGDSLDGAIISGTSGSNPQVGFGKAAAKFLWKLHGERYRSAWLDRQTSVGYLKRYENVRTPLDWISGDEAVVDRYLADPGTQFLFTVSAYYYLFCILDEVSKEGWAKQVPKDLPIYLLSGEMDPVGQFGSGVRQVYERLQRAGVKDLTLKLYPEGRHEMLNERNREEVYQDILCWLDAR